LSGYGALPFGYNPEEIWEAIIQVNKNKEPTFCIPSLLDAAGALAKKLCSLCPDPLRSGLVNFANSGSEIVESALKLCRAASGRFKILSTLNSYHGKTFGALSATGKELFQSGFGNLFNSF
jgi:acetylornithine/succinyldiaminopimelate/putrescine aminotransferase